MSSSRRRRCLNSNNACHLFHLYVDIAVNFVFPLFLGMVMNANEFQTKEKQKLSEIKNYLQHIRLRS